LQQAEVDVRVDDPGLVRQLGTARRADGGESLRLYLREGHEALSAPDGVERIAFTTPLSAGELDELSAGEAAMVDEIALMGIEFTASGSAAIEAGTFVFTRADRRAGARCCGIRRSGLAARLVVPTLVLARPSPSSSSGPPTSGGSAPPRSLSSSSRSLPPGIRLRTGAVRSGAVTIRCG
jgi:hypothetical protein